ncbi:histone H4-like TAF Taf6, SAGA complex subunit [Thecaphora frezii]
MPIPSTQPNAAPSTNPALASNPTSTPNANPIGLSLGLANGASASATATAVAAGSSGASTLGLSASSSTLGLPLSGVPTSVYPTDTIRDVAESLGITSLKDSIAAALAADVEYRVREIVQDAAKFMLHSKRDQLKTSDIDAALRARNIEPLYGFLPTSAGRLHSDAAGTTQGPLFRRVQTASGGALHYVEDEEIEFDTILQAGPKVGVGRGVGWGAHWLAIEGVQPALPQNPSPADLHDVAGSVGFLGPAAKLPSPATATTVTGANANTTATEAKVVAVAGTGVGDAQAVAKPLVKHILSRELQLYYERLTKAIVSPPPEADEDFDDVDDNEDDSGGLGGGGAAGQAGDDMEVDEEEQKGIFTPPRPGAAQVVPLKKFEKKGSGNRVRDAALASLAGDPGLHQLVPYLIQFVGGKVVGVLRGGQGEGEGEARADADANRQGGDNGGERETSEADNHLLSVMLSTVHAILMNPHIFVEPYLHQMMPTLLSILLTSSLSPLPPPGSSQHAALITAGPSSYTLRAYASALLAHIVERHGTSYPTLKPRLVTTMLKALLAGTSPDDARGGGGPRAAVGTKVGALMALRRMGKASFRTVLKEREGGRVLRRVGDWAERMGKEVWSVQREVLGALHDLLPPYVPHDASLTATEEERTRKLQEEFGTFWVNTVKGDARARRALEVEVGVGVSREGVGAGEGDAREGKQEMG